MRSRNVSTANGFTLVEVLVALVVTSLLLGVVMNGALLARDRGRRAADTSAAILLSRDLLAQAVVAPFAEGSRSGEEGRLRWEVKEEAAARDPRGRFALAAIQVDVTDSKGARLFAVATRRLKTVPVQ